MIYMDDLIIATDSEDKNIRNVKRVLSVASNYGICVNFPKCSFVKRKVTFLGHIVRGGEITPSAEKSLAIRKYPEPQTVKQVQAFLGLAEYFRKFVSNFSMIARPLSALTKKDAVFVFGEDQRQSFDQHLDQQCDIWTHSVVTHWLL